MSRKGVRAGQRSRKCRHCGGDRLRWRRRGLCWRCYFRPEIRRRYSVAWSDAYDLETGVDFLGAGAPCPGPLPDGPRTPERLLALALRADAGQQLWPADAAPAPAVGQVLRLFGVTAANGASNGKASNGAANGKAHRRKGGS